RFSRDWSSDVCSSDLAEAFADEANLTATVSAGDGGQLVVGAANFPESETLAHLYRIVLEAAGYDVEVRTIGNRELYEPALERGEDRKSVVEGREGEYE